MKWHVLDHIGASIMYLWECSSQTSVYLQLPSKNMFKTTLHRSEIAMMQAIKKTDQSRKLYAICKPLIDMRWMQSSLKTSVQMSTLKLILDGPSMFVRDLQSRAETSSRLSNAMQTLLGTYDDSSLE